MQSMLVLRFKIGSEKDDESFRPICLKSPDDHKIECTCPFPR